MKNELHQAHLSLGSNIEPQTNLPRAVEFLKQYGQVVKSSRVWESQSVGAEGPHFLNACALYLTELKPVELKERVIRPIEAEMGRVRNADKFAPRSIDIDIVLFDDRPLNTDYWEYAFVIVPLAELLPGFLHPARRERLSRVSEQIQAQVWIVPRADVVIS